MMTRQERAKQFMPFDAMKGLNEALRKREEQHARTERRELSEEAKANLSEIISKLSVGDMVELNYYCAFHDITRSGIITDINRVEKHLTLDEEKIFFCDIYLIHIMM